MSKLKSDDDDRRYATAHSNRREVTVVHTKGETTTVYYRGEEKHAADAVLSRVLGDLNAPSSSQAASPMSTATPSQLGSDLDRALAHFQRMQETLKAGHFDEYVTIDVGTGDHAVGPTGLTAVANFECKFGKDRQTFTGHIGSTTIR